LFLGSCGDARNISAIYLIVFAGKTAEVKRVGRRIMTYNEHIQDRIVSSLLRVLSLSTRPQKTGMVATQSGDKALKSLG
jgi:hypothetical protein